MSPEHYARALAALQRLTQAAHCKERMMPWLTALGEREAQGMLGGLSLAQHLRRLSGFGASEIGVLVAERRGQYTPFASAREIVARKLLLQEPEPDNAHCRRGTLLEPIIRAEFLRLSGATSRPDLALLIEQAEPPWPWMQATPDDLIVLDGRLGIVDYKAPAEPVAEVSLDYACQLHQVGLLAQQAGLAIAFRALVAWNTDTWRPDILPCPHDPALEEEIIAAGEHYWRSHVLTGELPAWPTVERLELALADLPNEAKAEIEALAARWLRLDLLSQEAHTLRANTHTALTERCRAHGLTQAVVSGPVKIAPHAVWDEAAVEARLPVAQRAACCRPQWDTHALLALLEAHGIDPSNARRQSDQLDVERAARWLIDAQGIPAAYLQTTDYRTRRSRRKDDQAHLHPVRAGAGATAFQFGGGP